MYLSIKNNLLFILLLTSFVAFGQKDFEKVLDKDGVVFYGKWKISKQGKPSVLNIMVHNTNDYNVNCTLSVSFFDSGLSKEESEPIVLCITPNKKMKGRKYGLSLISSEFSNEQIQSDSFTWEINNPEIKKVATCEK